MTWHLGYPHQGGFKLELLDPQERVVQTLAPEEGDGYVDEDTT